MGSPIAICDEISRRSSAQPPGVQGGAGASARRASASLSTLSKADSVAAAHPDTLSLRALCGTYSQFLHVVKIRFRVDRHAPDGGLNEAEVAAAAGPLQG
jgi:hypothetical protein